MLGFRLPYSPDGLFGAYSGFLMARAESAVTAVPRYPKQSSFDREPFSLLELAEGVEPPTYRLQSDCSAIEPCQRIKPAGYVVAPCASRSRTCRLADSNHASHIRCAAHHGRGQFPSLRDVTVLLSGSRSPVGLPRRRRRAPDRLAALLTAFRLIYRVLPASGFHGRRVRRLFVMRAGICTPHDPPGYGVSLVSPV